jgi:hypothetical protein
VRQNRKFSFHFNAILLVQPSSQKFSASRLPQIKSIFRAIPRPPRGAYRDRHGRWARDAVDANRAERRTAWFADGEVVWSWHLDADAKLAGVNLQATVTKKPDRRGERAINR